MGPNRDRRRSQTLAGDTTQSTVTSDNETSTLYPYQGTRSTSPNTELGSRARALIMTRKTQDSKTGDLLGLPHLLFVTRDGMYLKMFSKCDTYSHGVENDDRECSDVELFTWIRRFNLFE